MKLSKHTPQIFSRFLASLLIGLLFLPTTRAAEVTYDLVINGGRVMDPETGFDGVRNVGIVDGRIRTITKVDIEGKKTIHAAGLVVAPGFIDTHTHGQDVFAIKMALRDGVTTALDLEAGSYNIADWYAAREKNWPVNYGVTVSTMLTRMTVHDPDVKLEGAIGAEQFLVYLEQAAKKDGPGWSINISNVEQFNLIGQRLDEELRQGALGIGAGLAYMASGVTSYEMFEAQRIAARYGRLSAVHTRFHMDTVPPTEGALGFAELFTNASLLKAPLLVVHNNDYGWEEIEEKLQMARSQGLNMWSEYYPYEAVSTMISARFLQPEIWLDRYGYEYEKTIFIPDFDRFVDHEEFAKLVIEDPSRVVVGFIPNRLDWMPHWFSMPHMTVASDGGFGMNSKGELLPRDADYSEFSGHPRAAGSHAKSLRMAREYDVPLMHTLAQLSYWSALHLGDAGLLSMKERGRIQEGMVADITVFDADAVTHNSTYKLHQQGLPSTGIPWVIVNGQVVVENSEVKEAVYPGQPIRYPVEEKPRFEPLSAERWIREFSTRHKPVSGKPELSHMH